MDRHADAQAPCGPQAACTLPLKTYTVCTPAHQHACSCARARTYPTQIQTPPNNGATAPGTTHLHDVAVCVNDDVEGEEGVEEVVGHGVQAGQRCVPPAPVLERGLLREADAKHLAAEGRGGSSTEQHGARGGGGVPNARRMMVAALSASGGLIGRLSAW